jgi:hypothetical protein
MVALETPSRCSPRGHDGLSDLRAYAAYDAIGAHQAGGFYRLMADTQEPRRRFARLTPSERKRDSLMCRANEPNGGSFLFAASQCCAPAT